MNLSLAYSPCPNDTFAFHAMVNQLVDCEGLTFNEVLLDIEELNRAAVKEQFEICKMSYHAYFTVADRYIMLPVGSALGYGNGPLLVASKDSPLFGNDGEIDWSTLEKGHVLTPGELTTASLLLKVLFPKIERVSPTLFSTIAERVVDGSADGGVLIHEGRFNYREKGLRLIADLGLEWEKISQLPIPLGGVAVRRSLDDKLAKKVARVLRRSILFAKENRDHSKEYVAGSAQELEENIIDRHIEMFVNHYTIDIGKEGREAVDYLYSESQTLYPNLNRESELFIKLAK